MKKVFLSLSALLLSGHVVSAEEERVSVIFVHYSVGTQIVSGSWYPRCHIRDTLNIPPVVVGTDTARIVFRSYRMNNDLGGNPLSDTVSNEDCWDERFENYRYEYADPWHNRMRIWNSDNGMQGNAYAGLLNDLFDIPNKEDSAFWRAFETHNVPGSSGDSVSEHYDLFIVKNPYACWFQMTQAQADSQRILYQIVRDSLANHPEINFVFAFGTPMRIGHDGIDSAQARITYELATWFASDSFFTHNNSGPYGNIWKYDSYRLMCETSPDSVNRYCLKNAYWQGPPDGGSHLSSYGAAVAQDSLASFIRRATEDILSIRSGRATRRDIDLKIKDFREGQATIQEVLDVIESYNSGG